MKSEIFQAAFRPSRIYRLGVMVCWGLAVVVWLLYFESWRAGLLIVLSSIGLAYAWRQTQSIQSIYIRRQEIWLTIHGSEYAAELLKSSLIHPYGCCFHWKTEVGIIRQYVLPDMLPADDFRRLRVWAKFTPHL